MLGARRASSTRSRRRSPGWAEQDPEDWWRATQAALDAARRRRRRPASGCRARCTASSRSTPTTQVLRPAILWNDQRTAAECAEIEERVGLERLIALTGNRALTGFTAPKLLWLRAARAGDLRADRARSCCRRTTCGCGCAASTRSTSPTRPARCCSTSRAGAGATRCSTRSSVDRASGCRARSSRPRCRARRATASRSPPARATRRRARSASASTRAGRPLSVVLGTSGVVFAALDAFARRPAGARARVLPRGARRLARDGRDAVGGRARCAGCATRPRRASTSTTLVAEAAAWEPGRRGPDASCPTWPASARRTPTRTRAARSSGLSLRHDRGALVPRGARGRRLRAARLARPARRARRRCPTAAASPAAARAASCGCGSSRRCSSCRSSASAVDEGAAFGAALLGGVAGGLWADRAEAVEATRAPDAARSSRWRSGSSAYREGRERFRALYPALK